MINTANNTIIINENQSQTLPILEQRLKQNFMKKMTSLITNPQDFPVNLLSILDQGSKCNQRTVCKKVEENTFSQLQFQSIKDYRRQKLLIQSLNMIGNSTQQTQAQQQINYSANNNNYATTSNPELNHLLNRNVSKGSWEPRNPHFPYLHSFDDSEMTMELQIGKISLMQFHKKRIERGEGWQDREIQYLMKALYKIVMELFNCGVFHGDICLERIYLRKNLIGCYEPLLIDFCDASSSFEIVNSFNPDYSNYHNQEVTYLDSKEDRLQHELYMVGRTIQKCMLDLNSKHEQNLFKNQTNKGIERCLNYFKTYKSTQFSPKTIDVLQILLEKGSLEVLFKKFKKFNREQILIDEMKVVDEVFSKMCFLHPPLELLKRPIKKTSNQFSCDLSTQESDGNQEDETSSLNEIASGDNNSKSGIKLLKNNKNVQEANLQLTIQQIKKQQQKQQEIPNQLMKKCEIKRLKRKQTKNSQDLLQNQQLDQLVQNDNKSENYNNQKENDNSSNIINYKMEENKVQANGGDHYIDNNEYLLEDIQVIRRNDQYEDDQKSLGDMDEFKENQDGEDEEEWHIMNQKSNISSYEELGNPV